MLIKVKNISGAIDKATCSESFAAFKFFPSSLQIYDGRESVNRQTRQTFHTQIIASIDIDINLSKRYGDTVSKDLLVYNPRIGAVVA
jgi:hypothetical protein